MEEITNEELLKRAQEFGNTENEISFVGVADINGNTLTPKDVAEEIEQDVNLNESNVVLNNEGFEFELEGLSDKVSKKTELKPEEEGKEFIIKSVKINEPKLFNDEGEFIAPQKFNEKDPNSKVGYTSKVEIEYTSLENEDKNFVSILSGMKWFINVTKEGKKKLKPWFPISFKKPHTYETALEDPFVSTLTKLCLRYCKHEKVEFGSISREEFLNKNLLNKKVILKTKRWIYDGEEKTRIDIVNFV
jgi:hypothetical protein